MRRIIVVLALSAMIAGLVAGPVAAEGKFVSVPISLDIYSPCTGELIHFAGTWYIWAQTIEDEDGIHSVYRSRLSDVIGTGTETGDEYRLLNPSGGVQSITIVEGEPDYSTNRQIDLGTILVVTEGASPNFITQVVFKVSGDGNEPQPGDINMYTERCTSNVEPQPTD